MKNLKTMEAETLLSSKSYGLGVEKLWAIRSSKVSRQLGYEPTGFMHPIFYDHEKAHGDVFVSLALTGHLTHYERKENQTLRNDGEFAISGSFHYLEVEMGTHGDSKIEEKLKRYFKHFGTGNQFQVLFVVPDEAYLERVVGVFDNAGASKHYKAVVFGDVYRNALTAEITTRFETKSFQDSL